LKECFIALFDHKCESIYKNDLTGKVFKETMDSIQMRHKFQKWVLRS